MRFVSEGVTSLVDYVIDYVIDYVVGCGWLADLVTEVGARIGFGRSSNTESGDAGGAADNEAEAERDNSPSKWRGFLTELAEAVLYCGLGFGLEYYFFFNSVRVSLVISSYSWLSGALISIGFPHLLAVGIESFALFSWNALSASILLAGSVLLIMALVSGIETGKYILSSGKYVFSYIKDRCISRGEVTGEGRDDAAGGNDEDKASLCGASAASVLR